MPTPLARLTSWAVTDRLGVIRSAGGGFARSAVGQSLTSLLSSRRATGADDVDVVVVWTAPGDVVLEISRAEGDSGISLTRGVPMGVQAFDVAGQLLLVSAPLARTLGLAATPGTCDVRRLPSAIQSGLAKRLEEVSTGVPSGPEAFTLEVAAEDATPGTPPRRLVLCQQFAPLFDGAGAVVGVLGLTWDVTVAQAEARAAQTQVARYRRLVEASRDAIAFVGVDGTTQFINAAAESLYGHGLDDYLRAPDLPRRMLKPEYHAWFATFWAAFERDGVFPETDVQLEWVRKDGSELIAEHRFTNVRDEAGRLLGFLNLSRDVTERVRTERALERARERHSVATRQGGIAVVEFDLTSGLLEADAALLERLGVPGAAHLPDFWVRFVHEDDLPLVSQRIDRVRTGADDFGPDLDLRLKQADGAFRWFRLSASLAPPPPGAESPTLLGTMQDVHERRELELRVLEAQKLDAVGRLAGGVAHDFNNLLTIINGTSSELLEEGLVAGEARKLVEDVLHAGRSATHLVQNLLAFGRKQTQNVTWLDVNLVISSARRMLLRALGPTHELALELGPVDGLVRGDAAQLEQVMVNLVLNARDALGEGGHVTVRTVEVAAPPDPVRHALGPGRYVVLTVADDGTGMTPEVKARAMEPFFTTKPPGRGSGLGLATVYGIARQCGGEVFIESATGVGTTVGLVLPLGESLEEERRPSSQPSSARGRVLLVEDDERVRRFTSRALSRGGYSVEAVASPSEARRRLAEPAPFDLVITDWKMPEGGGRAVLEVVEAMQARPRLLVVSGYTRDEDLGRSGVGVLEKPWTTELLLRAVMATLRS
ncbi:MAG: PAS domain S-box protein [Myxococcaceae bacterium]|jgi:PAS domain S-box-containing protein|nr:PAS domain S-box protein [Myxococcaceae bacterium]